MLWITGIAVLGFSMLGGALAAMQPGEPMPHATAVPNSHDGYKAAAAYSARHAGRAVLVMKDGKVAFEQYDGGWTPSRPHPLASGTKSFTGVMAMMAVQDELLSLDERVCDTITEWRNDPARSKITVRHLLTLSSGLDASPVELESRGGSRLLGEGASLRAQRKGLDKAPPPTGDLAKAAVSDAIKVKHEAGSRFEYGPTHFYVFCELLNRKLAASDRPEKSTGEYLTKQVFEAIGINAARMGRDRAGNPNLPGGCLLTAREWAKFGQFVLDRGSVRASDGTMKEVLRPDLLDQCFVPSATNPAYGLTWWLLTGDAAAGDVADGGGNLGERVQAASLRGQSRAVVGPDGKPLHVYMAAGLGKQRLYVIPQYGLVVVRFAEAAREGARFDNAEFLKPILGVK